jgi:hypothetical protein
MTAIGFSKSVQHTSETDIDCYSKKLRYISNSTTVPLTGSFVSQYSYTGEGRFVGFNMEFDHKDVEVKLLIDSEEIFSLSASDLQDHGNNTLDDNIGILWEPNKKIITFHPRYPICFTEDVEIQAKETAGSHSRNHYLVCIEQVA